MANPDVETPELLSDIEVKLERLMAWFATRSSVSVAFSGGSDSALLAWAANDVLGDSAQIITAVSPSLAGREAHDCHALAVEWGLNWFTVTTDEMENAAYRRNDPDRCFYCKNALMDAIAPLSTGTIVLGVNVDDLSDHRPGQEAAAAAGARFPFVEIGIDKSDVRSISRRLGLSTWDKPAAACLASRIPHGTEVTVKLLRRVERAEDLIRAVGIRQVRVRDHGDIARIEVEVDDMDVVLKARDQIEQGCRALGYRFVSLDLGGFRSGSLNPVES
ncbi:MAG: ATP-dependent sacrificial sulfur transferase LarE [Actinomycetota bacterium]|nr:ATP-dependent sacrificial sulfur transferase LarE [Actinomycetota bacterium]MDA3015944.1 ATP-dependent sacrificial sulfur transferase LarE [Actinomycetota bacterium]MDA3027967.1 ATP-dependent sacrificial sulfur transferase LarE [Actinomycetota bacterium]